MMELAHVKVVCDSSRHARGKVATLIDYGVAEDGTVGVVPPMRGRQLTRDHVRSARASADALDDVWASDDDAHARQLLTEAAQRAQRQRDAEKRPCKLCGSRLPADLPKVHEAIRKYVRHAESDTITLSALADMMKHLERQ